MAKKPKSPTLQLELTDEQRNRAVKSNSGGCLIADAIKEQYPHLTNIVVDMATIRVSDRKAAERYTYLTPPDAQHVLLSFDQGWPAPVDSLKIQRAVHIKPIESKEQSPYSRNTKKQRDEKRAALIEKERAGTITDDEQKSLNKSRAGRERGRRERAERKEREERGEQAPRPTSAGSPEVTANGGTVSVKGGHAPVQGKPHPNLLRGRNRHFGAKLADPGEAFREAVAEAVAADRAARES